MFVPYQYNLAWFRLNIFLFVGFFQIFAFQTGMSVAIYTFIYYFYYLFGT